jgi:uncharacterized protein DUF1549/uncharacterized protein DUF1553
MAAWRVVLLGSAFAAPLALGATELVYRAREGAPTEAVPDFTLRILPLLTKAGCNSGQCHGAAGGQSGFALSLRGYEPDADYDAITRERMGRRIDLADPSHSLLLRKPSMRIPHKGGRKLAEGSAAYEEVSAWIAAGAPRRSRSGEADARGTMTLEVEPARTMGKPGDSVVLRARVRPPAGEAIDATDVCLFTSNDESVARVDSQGKVEIVGPGETAILIQYPSCVGFARVGSPFGAPYEPKNRAADSVDGWVERKLGEMGVAVSGPCDDATFLRRATLDLAGRLPDPKEIREFLADASPGKREAAVDRLVASPQAITRWTRWLADLCRLRQESMGDGGAKALQGWLGKALAERRPLDAILREAIASQGDPAAPGPAAFNFATGGPSEQMEFVTRTFLGYRFQCAQCHQHPFDRWSRQDYFGAAAFFARVRRERGRVVLAPFGEFVDPKTGRDAIPKYPGGSAAAIPEGGDRRPAFADWLLDRDAMRFDRAMANRLWKELLGRGLVEPVDDLRSTNPASNAELLDFLARRLRDGGRELLAFVALVAKSDAYGRAAEPRPGAERDERYHSHAAVRPIPGPILLDALAHATGAVPSFPQAPGTTRAQEVADEDGGGYALRVLGRCPRDGSIDPATPAPPTIGMALHFIHGLSGSAWLSPPGGRLDALAKNPPAPNALAEELFLATLGRLPSPAERTAAVQALGPAFDAERAEDFLWALLATSEFATQH